MKEYKFLDYNGKVFYEEFQNAKRALEFAKCFGYTLLGLGN